MRQMRGICRRYVVLGPAALLLFTLACGRVGPPTLDGMAERYVRLALQLAQHDPSIVDDWHGPDAWKPGPRQPVGQLAARIDSLQKDLKQWTSDTDDPNRVRYLTEQLRALAALASRLGGVSLPFDAEAIVSFGPFEPPVAIDISAAPAARAALEALLTGSGTLASRYVAYRKSMTVPSSKVEPLMRAALGACRDASQVASQLPVDERIELVFGHGAQWDGFARYLGNHRTRIEINLDSPLDVTRALRLACHEGYPGHHAQSVWIDDALVKGHGWQEFALSPSFGRHLLVSEGAAEAGTDLAFPPEQREEIYRTVLLPAAGLRPAEAARLVRVEEGIAALEPVITDVSRAYLDNTVTQAQAIDRLRDEALTPDPETLLAFAERRRTRMLAYPMGRALVHRTLGRADMAGARRLFTDEPFTLR